MIDFQTKASAMTIPLLIVALFTATAAAQQPAAIEAKQSSNWLSFRNGGSSHVESNVDLPLSWSPKQGIAWQAELPGYGQSAPLIIGDRVLTTGVEGPEKNVNLVICLDRKSGEELWRERQVSTRPGPSNFMFSRAAPTPVADLGRAFAFFESGDLIAVSLEDGKCLWKRDLKTESGDFASRHGLGSSLAQTDDLIFINLEHDGPSALYAIDKSDGKTKWTAQRPEGSSWSSPAIMRLQDTSQVIVSSAGEVTGYDADSGRELWKIPGLVGNTVPSPLVVGNRIYIGARKSEFGSVASSAKSNLCLEFKEGQESPTVLWRAERCVTDYSSPVVCGSFLYLINGDGILGCLDKDTGEEKYRQRLGFESWATPIVNGNRIFVFGKNGSCSVLEAGDTFRKLADNQLWDPNDPPAPISYVEFFPSKGESETSESATSDNHKGHGTGHSPQSNPAAGMLAGLLKEDRDGDGVLRDDEIPSRLASAMESIDLNGNGALEKNELEEMARRFAAKRSGSKQASRDPIVYGVAADANGILVRTGTRLFAIGGKQ